MIAKTPELIKIEPADIGITKESIRQMQEFDDERLSQIAAICRKSSDVVCPCHVKLKGA